MYQSVKDYFPGFTERFEGHTSFMYCDVLGLVTCGRGNLIDPIYTALYLPWQMPDGSTADKSVVTQQWNTVKARQDLKLHGGGAYASVTTVRLSEQAIDDLTNSKALEMEGHLRARFPNWDQLPADAQLGTLSLSWACGPAFRFPAFEAALKAGDFVTCATECQMNATGNPGLVPRNAANMQLFVNAATSVNAGLPAELLTGV